MPQVIGAALRFALLLTTVYAYPGSYSDSQLRACAAGSCPSAHGQAPSAGSALSVAGKTDGGSYIPGETIQVSNAGGGQYALYAEAGGTKLSREDDGPMTLTAPASGDLVIVGIRAAGRAQCTYQKFTLTPSTSPRVPPSGSTGNEGGGESLQALNFVPYVGYAGNLRVGGSISSIKTSGTSQTFTYSLTGVDPSCSSPSSAINSCGIHIHAGTSCTENAQGHYYTGTVTANPWTTVVYTAVVYTAGGSKTVNTGATNVQIRGRTFIIHDRAGVRVACAKITAKPASSACSVPLCPNPYQHCTSNGCCSTTAGYCPGPVQCGPICQPPPPPPPPSIIVRVQGAGSASLNGKYSSARSPICASSTGPKAEWYCGKEWDGRAHGKLIFTKGEYSLKVKNTYVTDYDRVGGALQTEKGKRRTYSW